MKGYVEAFQNVFQQAVTARLRSHRPVGVQLSGGLDSGAIVSFAVKALRKENKQLSTFIYFPPADFPDFTPKHIMPNEWPFIKSTVEHVGNITDNYLDFEGKDSYSELDDILEIMEMPYKFFENSFWLKGMFEEAQTQGRGVILNGGRGNLSISWGSAMDYYATLLKNLKWLRLVNELNQYSKNVGGNRLRRQPTFARVAFPIIDKIFPLNSIYEFPMLINPDFANKTNVFS